MGLMQWSHVVPIARGIFDVLSGPSVKITEVTAVTWLSVLSRLVRIFTAVGPVYVCVCTPVCTRVCVVCVSVCRPALVYVCVFVHGNVVGDSADRCVMTAYHCRCARVRVAGGPFWHVFSPRLHLCLWHSELGLTKEKQGGEVGGYWVPNVGGWVGLAVEKMCWKRSHMVSLPCTVQEQEAGFADSVGQNVTMATSFLLNSDCMFAYFYSKNILLLFNFQSHLRCLQ